MRDMYAFSRANLHYVVEQLDEDGDLWPEGSGNVERTGMGPEKLDNAVYLIRGLYDFEAMAKATGHADDAAWAREQADRRAEAFEETWWFEPQGQYADSLVDDAPDFQGHWIGVNPMEAELYKDGEAIPGAATYLRGNQALAARETDCYSGERPYNRGLFHTDCEGGPTGTGERTIFSLGTAVQAVGEGNYGRLGPDQQGRYTGADAETMFGEPALPGEPAGAEGEPDEQPGAMPEILPSPDFDAGDGPNDKNVMRCWTCRSMFMQAWGNYGTAWPVIHQQLGVAPDLGNGRLDVVPQVPAGQTRVRGEEHPPRRRLVRRVRLPRRHPLHDHHRHDRGGGHEVPHRPHAAARVEGRHRRAGRRDADRLPVARDQPRPRGARDGGCRPAPHARHHDEVAPAAIPGPRRAVPGRGISVRRAARPRG